MKYGHTLLVCEKRADIQTSPIVVSVSLCILVRRCSTSQQYELSIAYKGTVNQEVVCLASGLLISCLSRPPAAAPEGEKECGATGATRRATPFLSFFGGRRS